MRALDVRHRGDMAPWPNTPAGVLIPDIPLNLETLQIIFP